MTLRQLLFVLFSTICLSQLPVFIAMQLLEDHLDLGEIDENSDYMVQTLQNQRVVFKFSFEGRRTTYVEYTDPLYGPVKMIIPDFMRTFKGDRIGMELQYYVMNNKRWSQRMILEIVFYALTYAVDTTPLDFTHPDYPCLLQFEGWLEEPDICEWEGITCGNPHPTSRDRPRAEIKLIGPPPVEDPYDWSLIYDSNEKWPDAKFVTKIELPELRCKGTLPEELFMLSELRRLDLRGNKIRGTIPTTYGEMTHLDFVDLSDNLLTGLIPTQLQKLTRLKELWLNNNRLEGSVHFFLTRMSRLHFLDLSNNLINGTIPTKELVHVQNMMCLFLENNQISGTMPTDFGTLTELGYLYLSGNRLTGTLPTEIGRMDLLHHLWLSNNQFSGTIPTEMLSILSMEELKLGHNRLTGTIPAGNDMGGEQGFFWSNLHGLEVLTLNNNRLTGSLPPALFYDVSENLMTLELGFNQLTGTLPTELGRIDEFVVFSVAGNQLTGTIPNELGQFHDARELNLTGNRFVGTVPAPLCTHGDLNRQLFGCNAVVCPSGTYSPTGAANSRVGACRYCPNENDSGDPPVSKRLGQTSCGTTEFETGDMDGDGIRSPREVLNLLFFMNCGLNWGPKFRDWLDESIPDCELPGITCVGSAIAKIDLTDADVCANAINVQGDPEECQGLPAELSDLSSLEVISISKKKHLRSTIPTELAKLKRLRYLDLSKNPKVGGTIPTELGTLSNLKVLNLAESNFTGTIPTQLFRLPLLEKLHLGANGLTGTIPKQIGIAKNLRELMLSRLSLHGTIPKTIAKMSSLENLELYASNLHGRIPNEIDQCTNLKRLDAYNNILSGTIPSSLANIETLQIIHLKKNQMTGTLPHELGNLPFLTWIDVSSNVISGSIPESLANIRSLKDLRLGGNRIHEPIPTALCNNNRINGGRARSHGCDAVLCPLGYMDSSGYAKDYVVGCTKCPAGTTTIYLGSTECIELHADDILNMLYDVMGGELWDQTEVFRWRSDINICHWNGVICGDDGALLSLTFPLTQATDALGDPMGVDHKLYYPG